MNNLLYKVLADLRYRLVSARTYLLSTVQRILFLPRLRAIRRCYVILVKLLRGEERKQAFLDHYVLLRRSDRLIYRMGHKVRLDGSLILNPKILNK